MSIDSSRSMRSGGMRPGAGAGAGAVGTLNWRAYREVRCRNFYAMAGRLAGENAGPRKPWLSLAEFMTKLFQTNTLEQWEWASAMRCVRLAILPHRLSRQTAGRTAGGTTAQMPSSAAASDHRPVAAAHHARVKQPVGTARRIWTYLLNYTCSDCAEHDHGQRARNADDVVRHAKIWPRNREY